LGAGIPVSGIAEDFNGTARDAIHPSIGAFELPSGFVTKTLNLKLFLEGLYAVSGTMNPAWDETGPHFTSPIADQIMVFVHEEFPPYSMEISYNPDISTDGTATIELDPSFSGSYYISVKHRNSIETWSATPVSFAGTTVNYDFSTAASQAMGSNLKLMDGVYAIYCGDENQDGVIDAGDLIDTDNDAAIFVSGYVNTDINGDGQVNTTDLILISSNAELFISAFTPY
jgi:hypothetical protein